MTLFRPIIGIVHGLKLKSSSLSYLNLFNLLHFWEYRPPPLTTLPSTARHACSNWAQWGGCRTYGVSWSQSLIATI